MAISFQSLEFIGSTTTIQQRAFARHPSLGSCRKLAARPVKIRDQRQALSDTGGFLQGRL
jgi:hypothetical protein